jgi:hypothetical protein
MTTATSATITVKTPAEFQELYNRAHAAGMAAGTQTQPVGMMVVQRANPLDDTSPVKQAWAVPEGVCGFAWITIRPATSKFARWLKKTNKGRTAYGGGLQIWVGQFNQSMQRKEDYAAAFAKVLREAGVNAWSGSRMD